MTNSVSGSLPNPNSPEPWPQPRGTIPVVNVLGIIVGWAAHPDIPHEPDLILRDPAANRGAPIVCKNKTILWFDYNAQLLHCPPNFPCESWPHYIPVLNSEGTIIDWRPWTDDWLENPPPQNPRPILSDSFRGHVVAWIDERA